MACMWFGPYNNIHARVGTMYFCFVYETRGVSHCRLAVYIKKYLKAKEELWKLKYFTMQKYNLPKKNPLKETKIFQDIIITL